MRCCGRPEYAPESSDDEEEDDVEFSLTKQQQVVKVAADADHETKLDAERDDRRLRRLHDRQQDDVDSDEDREARYVAPACVFVGPRSQVRRRTCTPICRQFVTPLCSFEANFFSAFYCCDSKDTCHSTSFLFCRHGETGANVPALGPVLFVQCLMFFCVFLWLL